VHLARVTRKWILVTGLCGCFGAALAGQISRENASVSGEVIWENGGTTVPLSVEAVSDGRVADRAQVTPDGDFVLQNVPPGQYELRVTDIHGNVIQSQFISAAGHIEGLVFRLNGAASSSPVAGTVTLRSLMRKVPGAARKELERANAAARKGDEEVRVRHLQKALSVYPDYMEAHNDLGVHYIEQHNYAQAAAEFEQAVRLDPRAARPQINLAMAYVMLGRRGDAETAARRAMADDPASENARKALAVVLQQ